MHDNWRNRRSNREPWRRRLVNCKKFCWQDSLFLLMLLNLQSAECFLSFVSFLFFLRTYAKVFFFLDATVIDSWKNFRLSNCSYHTLGNLRSTRFWGDGNYNRTWRNDLYDIAHALADHLAVVVPSTTWNWSVCVCVVAKREYLTFIPIRFVAFSN